MIKCEVLLEEHEEPFVGLATLLVAEKNFCLLSTHEPQGLYQPRKGRLELEECGGRPGRVPEVQCDSG